MATIRTAHLDDVPAITAIYNYYVRTSAATFDLQEHSIEQRVEWFHKYDETYPLLVAEIEGEIAGYCCLSPFREKDAFVGSTELSIYLSPDHHGKGIGKKLMNDIISIGKERGFHTIISSITGGNVPSVKLHDAFGFEFIGNFRQVGYKFDEWQDCHFYQLVLA